MRACGCANLSEFAIDFFDGLEGLEDDKGDEVQVVFWGRNLAWD